MAGVNAISLQENDTHAKKKPPPKFDGDQRKRLTRSERLAKIKCYNCQKKGHSWRNCKADWNDNNMKKAMKQNRDEMVANKDENQKQNQQQGN